MRRANRNCLVLPAAWICTLLISCTSAFAQEQKFEEDRVTRWQMEDARNQWKDQERSLLFKIDYLKRKIWDLDIKLNEVLKEKKYAEEDLRNLQHSLTDVKLRLL
jgi:hypothetical protein